MIQIARQTIAYVGYDRAVFDEHCYMSNGIPILRSHNVLSPQL